MRAPLTREEEAAAEAEVMAAVVAMAAVAVDTSAAAAGISAGAADISAEVHASELVGTSAAVDISAAFALAECVLAVRTSAARVLAAGPGYPGLRRDQVSAANARLRSTEIPAGPPAARQR